jgi:hypothetical protein
MKKILIAIVLVVLVSGCVTSSRGQVGEATTTIEDLGHGDFHITGSGWEGSQDRNCEHAEYGSAYLDVVTDKQQLYCRIYINGQKSKYGHDSDLGNLQYIYSAKVPNKIKVVDQYDGYAWKTRLDTDKDVRLCCRIWGSDTEICHREIINSYC